MPIFDRDNPAANIEVLVEHLIANQTEDHYFRGQQTFYERSVPSALRHAVKGDPDEDGWLELSQDFGANLPARMRARGDFRGKLLLVFGRVVGNLLSQQYGISSDAFDFTAEPTIAAFFATRSYPEYEPYTPKTDSELGIISRITIRNRTPPSLSEMERTLSSLYVLDPPSGRKIWFDDVRSIRQRILKGTLLTDAARDKHLQTEFPMGFTSGDFLKSAAYVPYPFIEAAFLQRSKEINFTQAEDYIRSSRTQRQQGGVYFPPTMHTGFVSQQISLASRNARDYTATPGTIETLGAQRVYNFHANPNVETFFFRHDATKGFGVESLSLLWPSKEEDYLLAHLVELCKGTMKPYLDDFKTQPLDFDLGLIDPGYLE